MQQEYNQYMRRCFELASNGLGRTRPNPLVGCVIVKDGKIISEGYHQQHGEFHAERNAILRINNTKEGLSLLQGATLYVNLEPCSHYGLTPPCADLIIESKIKKVVCCNDDPNPLVAGRGFNKLREAGIEVVQHVLCDEGRFLNRRFFTFMEEKRPYIILKWAQSADGYMAPLYKPYWISNPLATQLSHKWRSEESAILVGSGTVKDDNPSLTTRHWYGKNPTRIVLGRCENKESFNVFDNLAETIHYDSHLSASEILCDLYSRKIQSIIVEGGKHVLDLFISANLWDEARIIESPSTFGDGLSAPIIEKVATETRQINDNTLSIIYNF